MQMTKAVAGVSCESDPGLRHLLAAAVPKVASILDRSTGRRWHERMTFAGHTSKDAQQLTHGGMQEELSLQPALSAHSAHEHAHVPGVEHAPCLQQHSQQAQQQVLDIPVADQRPQAQPAPLLQEHEPQQNQEKQGVAAHSQLLATEQAPPLLQQPDVAAHSCSQLSAQPSATEQASSRLQKQEEKQQVAAAIQELPLPEIHWQTADQHSSAMLCQLAGDVHRSGSICCRTCCFHGLRRVCRA